MFPRLHGGSVTPSEDLRSHGAMKPQIFLPVTLVMVVGLMGVMKMRRNEQETETKRFRLQDIKLRVTKDILDEFKSELALVENQMKEDRGYREAMEAHVAELQEKSEKAKADEEECQGDQVGRWCHVDVNVKVHVYSCELNVLIEGVCATTNPHMVPFLPTPCQFDTFHHFYFLLVVETP